MKRVITKKQLTHLQNLDITNRDNIIKDIFLFQKKKISFIFEIYKEKTELLKNEIMNYHFTKNNIKFKEIILTSLIFIEYSCDTAINALTDDNTEIAAQEKIQNQFSQYPINANLKKFLFLLFFYEISKFHNNKIRIRLKIIRTFINKIQIDQSSIQNPQTNSSLSFISQKFIHSTLEISKKMIIFLSRLRFILQITEETEEKFTLSVNGKYLEEIQYHLYLIFQKDLPEILFKKNNKDINNSNEYTLQKNQTYIKTFDKLSKISKKLDSTGNQIFNQQKIFLLHVNELRLIEEKYFLSKTLIIENFPDLSKNEIKKKIIYALIPSIKKKDNQKIIEYKDFLLEYFLQIEQKFFQFIKKIDISNTKLLLYLFTPNYFLEISRLSMFYNKMGKIYFQNNKNHIRFIYPKEFIKLILIFWWNTNVLSNLQDTYKNDKNLYNTQNRKIKKYFIENQSLFLEEIFLEIPQAKKLYHEKETEALISILQKSYQHIEHTVYTRFLGKEYFYLSR